MMAPRNNPTTTSICKPTAIHEILQGEDLDEILLCPVCYEFCVPPIFICVSGHSICQVCKTKLKKQCPYCRKMIKDGRNFALENLYNGTKFSCLYKTEGCEQTPKGEEYQGHMETCDFMPFSCPLKKPGVNTCKDIGFKNAMLHFKADHKLQKTSVTGEYCYHDAFIVRGEDILLANWQFDGREFIERITIDHSGDVRLSILILGSKHEADEYIAELQLFRTGVDCCPHIFKGIYVLEVQSIKQTSEDVRICEKSVLLPFGDFEHKIGRLEASTYKFHWVSRVDIKKKKISSQLEQA